VKGGQEELPLVLRQVEGSGIAVMVKVLPVLVMLAWSKLAPERRN